MPITRYITANGMLLGERTDSGPRIDYVPDALGSIVAAVDQNLNTTYTAAYTPYGAALASTGTAPNFTWAGNVGYLASAGRPYAEYSVRARILSSKSGRWTSVDRLWPTWPAYAYASIAPTLWRDPSGLLGCCGGGNLGGSKTLGIAFSLSAPQTAACQCNVNSATGNISLRIYKLMTASCVGEVSGGCDCDINQWFCGTVIFNGNPDPNFKGHPCDSYVKDRGYGTDPGNSQVCAPKNISCIPFTPIDIVSMMATDAPGYTTVAKPFPTGRCIGSADLKFFGEIPIKAQIAYSASFKTCCDCPGESTLDVSTSGFGSCLPWTLNFTADVEATSGTALWTGDCASANKYCSKATI